MRIFYVFLQTGILAASIRPENTPVIEVSVLQQKSFERAIDQKIKTYQAAHQRAKAQLWQRYKEQTGCTCGYHALYNAVHDNDNDLNNPELYMHAIEPLLETIHNQRTNSLQATINQTAKQTRLRITTARLSDTDKAIALSRLEDRNIFNNDGTVKSSSITNAIRVLRSINERLDEPIPDLIKYYDTKNNAVHLNWLTEDEMKSILTSNHRNKTTIPTIVISNTLLTMEQLLEEKPITQALNAFKQSNNSKLNLVFTEAGYNHWIAYKLEKKNGKVTIKQYNSISSHKPNKFAQKLLKDLSESNVENPTIQEPNQPKNNSPKTMVSLPKEPTLATMKATVKEIQATLTKEESKQAIQKAAMYEKMSTPELQKELADLKAKAKKMGRNLTIIRVLTSLTIIASTIMIALLNKENNRNKLEEKTTLALSLGLLSVMLGSIYGTTNYGTKLSNTISRIQELDTQQQPIAVPKKIQ